MIAVYITLIVIATLCAAGCAAYAILYARQIRKSKELNAIAANKRKKRAICRAMRKARLRKGAIKNKTGWV